MAFLLLVSSNNALSQSSLKKYFKLSCPEKRWVILHIFIAKSAFKISLEASQKAKELVVDSLLDGDLNGGQLDAFRHAYWMACLTQKHGWRAAYSLGKAHEKGNFRDFKKHRNEDGSLPDEQSEQMDFLNNDVGIELGKCNINSKSDELIIKIKEMILSGKLFILKKDKKGNLLKCDGEIITNEELKGKWKTPKCIVPSIKVKIN